MPTILKTFDVKCWHEQPKSLHLELGVIQMKDRNPTCSITMALLDYLRDLNEKRVDNLC